MPLIRKEPERASAAEPAGDLAAGLANPSADLRWAAARTAAGQPHSVSLLAEALARENDPRVREAILTALARIATADSVLAIVPCMRSDDSSLRAAAMDALRAMPNAVTPFLAELLADPDSDVRLLACDLALCIPGTEAIRHLGTLLETETHPNVCAAAVDALTEVGDAASVPVLRRCAARFPDEPFLRFAIGAAIDRLDA